MGARLRVMAIEELGQRALQVTRRFPGVLLAALASAVLCLTLEPNRDVPWQPLVLRLLSATLLGIPALFIAHVLLELRPRLRRAVVLGLPVVALVLFCLSYEVSSQHLYWLRVGLYGIGLHFGVALVGHLIGGSGFWHFNRLLFFRFLEASLYGLVIYSGVAVAFVSLDALLDVDVRPRAYQWLAVLVGLVFHPTFFLAGVPTDLRGLAHSSDYPRLTRVLTQYVLVPLLVIYLLIDGAYVLKIAVAAAWPRGSVGWLVSSVGAFGILTVLLLYPASLGPAAPRWPLRLARAFYGCLVVLALVLMAAAWRRIDQYGLTEPRYFLMVGGAWLLLMGVLYCRQPFGRLALLPATLCGICVLTSVGPWGAFGLSLQHQEVRLRAALAQGKLEGEAARTVSGALVYLHARDALDRLPELQAELGKSEPSVDPAGLWRHLAPTMDIDVAWQRVTGETGPIPGYWVNEERIARYLKAPAGHVVVQPYRLALRFDLGDYPGRHMDYELDGTPYSLRLEAQALELWQGGAMLLTVPLAPLLEVALQQPEDAPTEVHPAVLTTTVETPAVQAKLIADELSAAQPYRGDPARCSKLAGLLLWTPRSPEP